MKRDYPKWCSVALITAVYVLAGVAGVLFFQLSNFFQLSIPSDLALGQRTFNFKRERHVCDLEADLRSNHLGVGFHDLCFPAARHSACSHRHRKSTVLACLWHQTPVSIALNNKKSHKTCACAVYLTPRTADDAS